MIVGITDNRVNEEKYGLYESWLREGRPDVEVVRLTPQDGNGASLGECAGLVLTGGGDVDPALYGNPGGRRHPAVYEISPERDGFELDLVRRALDSSVPVLGICRGLQLVNVALGGTLFLDLEEAGYPAHRPLGGVKCRHDVRIAPMSYLGRVLRTSGGEVLSSHHQAVEKPAPGLSVSARSGDGVVEAMELPGERDGAAPRALLVQWHPERVTGPGDPLSGGLRDLFLQLLHTPHRP